MTNEELALAAQSGDADALEEVWGRVKKTACIQSQRFSSIPLVDNAVSVEDLHQMAAVAFMECVRDYKEEAGFSFITALKQYVKWCLWRYLDGRRKPTSAHRQAMSLDAPFAVSGDGDDLPLSDVLEDEAAQEPFDLVSLRSDVAAAVDDLPEDQRRAVRLRYFQQMKGRAFAAALGLPEYVANRVKNSALSALRHSPRLRPYDPLGGAVEWRHVSLTEFNTTQTSSTEDAALRRLKETGP